MDYEKLKIFCDFDGTITIYDTWIEMGEYFIKDKAAWAAVIKDFETQKIGARECFLRECALVKNFDIDKFNSIIDSQNIDPGFIGFYNFCANKGISLKILIFEFFKLKFLAFSVLVDKKIVFSNSASLKSAPSRFTESKIVL